jgi:acetolactate synthase-1/2/3 large subunit
MNQTGADVLVQHLLANGVSTIFAITGAGNLAVVDALVRDANIKIVYSHHEQAAVMEAQGYSRASGKIGVALVTTGGGSSNAATGMLSAYLDSVPVLLISGNENSFYCENWNSLRAYGVQGFDSVSMMKPVCKLSDRIVNVGEVPEKFNSAIAMALSGRKGPVHIDFPMDLQRQKCETGLVDKAQLNPTKASPLDYPTLIEELADSAKPLLYIGNGCRESIVKIKKFIEKTGIPYLVSWSALDLVNHDDPLNVGTIGIYGSRSGNITVQQCDLLLAIGTRLAIPQIGYDKFDFARQATKYVVDIDQSELDKFADTEWHLINADAYEFTNSILEQVEHNPGKYEAWISDIELIKSELPLIDQVGPPAAKGYVHSADVLAALPGMFNDDAVIVTDVGAPLLNGCYIFKPGEHQRFFTSQGLGEMGFGLPAAIGAYFVDPTRQIVCLNADGAMMLNLQELQVVKQHKIPLKLFIFNNDGYAQIKVSQENLFDARYSGSGTTDGISFPSFKDIAISFGFEYLKITSMTELQKIKTLLVDSKAWIIDIHMDPSQKYFPRLSTKKMPDGVFVSPPLEDLAPLIPIETLGKLLGYRPTDESYKVRGLTPKSLN